MRSRRSTPPTRDDPVRIVVRGEERPKELAHAELVTEWVRRLDPAPSDELLLAARAHHLRRWVIPRSSYPTGRSGYLRWRKAEHAQHAEDVARILDAAGYDDAAVTRVQDLVRKRGLGRDPATRDPDAQTLEDALCLVFLETQLTDLAVASRRRQDDRHPPQERGEDERAGPRRGGRDRARRAGSLAARASARRRVGAVRRRRCGGRARSRPPTGRRRPRSSTSSTRRCASPRRPATRCR